MSVDAIEEEIKAVALEFIELSSNNLHGLDHRRYVANTILRRFKCHFGVTPRHCAYLWFYCHEKVHQKDVYLQKKHLLWTLNILKTDSTEHEMSSRWKADEKTIRKWLYLFLDALGDLGVVSIVFIVGILCCTSIL